ncbi:MAG TPA: hypothetical protein VJ851_10800 [Jatrophihabitans sp.]|nr:hypothetical protein [Jatrophihabitans sp.]
MSEPGRPGSTNGEQPVEGMRTDRFVDAVPVAVVFRRAPQLDWVRIREEIDQCVDQGISLAGG